MVSVLFLEEQKDDIQIIRAIANVKNEGAERKGTENQNSCAHARRILNTTGILLWSFAQPWAFHPLRADFHEWLTFPQISKALCFRWARNPIKDSKILVLLDHSCSCAFLAPNTSKKASKFWNMKKIEWDNFSSSNFGPLRIQVHTFFGAKYPWENISTGFIGL